MRIHPIYRCADLLKTIRPTEILLILKFSIMRLHMKGANILVLAVLFKTTRRLTLSKSKKKTSVNYWRYMRCSNLLLNKAFWSYDCTSDLLMMWPTYLLAYELPLAHWNSNFAIYFYFLFFFEALRMQNFFKTSHTLYTWLAALFSLNTNRLLLRCAQCTHINITSSLCYANLFRFPIYLSLSFSFMLFPETDLLLLFGPKKRLSCVWSHAWSNSFVYIIIKKKVAVYTHTCRRRRRVSTNNN